MTETGRQILLSLYMCGSMDEVLSLRAALRRECTVLDLAKWGFRQPRKPRAEISRSLRRPTRAEVERAEDMLYDMTAHEVEQYFNRIGVQMTRNRLSKLGGARP